MHGQRGCSWIFSKGLTSSSQRSRRRSAKRVSGGALIAPRLCYSIASAWVSQGSFWIIPFRFSQSPPRCPAEPHTPCFSPWPQLRPTQPRHKHTLPALLFFFPWATPSLVLSLPPYFWKAARNRSGKNQQGTLVHSPMQSISGFSSPAQPTNIFHYKSAGCCPAIP